MTVVFPKVRGRTLTPSQNQFIENAPYRTLIVGQKNGGTAVAGALVQDIGNSGEENTLFGADSMAAGQVRWFKKINQVSPLDVISLDDNGAGVAATSTVTFATNADEDGEFVVSIGSDDHVFIVPVTSGDTPTDAAAALVALVNADTRVQANAGNVAGVVTLTAVNAGVEGNHIGIRGTGSAGAMTMTVTAFASGATNPVLTTVFDPIEDYRYKTIVFPTTYDRSVLENFLDARWVIYDEILDGVGIMVLRDTVANVITVVNASNSQNMATGINVPNSTETNRFDSSIFVTSNQIAAYVAGVRSLRLTTGADVSNLVVADAVDDKTGGIELSSLPYANTPLADFPLIQTKDLLKKSEIEELNAAGAFVMSNDPNATQVVLGQTVTAYKTNNAGNLDFSLKYLNYVDTVSAIREFFFNNLRARFRQSRLTSGELTEHRSIENKSTIIGYVDSLYLELADRQLVVKGEEAFAYFKANRTIDIDLLLGKATLFAKMRIVTQLREIDFDLQLVFDI